MGICFRLWMTNPPSGEKSRMCKLCANYAQVSSLRDYQIAGGFVEMNQAFSDVLEDFAEAGSKTKQSSRTHQANDNMTLFGQNHCFM